MKTITFNKVCGVLLCSLFLSGCITGTTMKAKGKQSLEEKAWQALSKNETEKSEKYYKEVLENRSFLKKIWPFGAELDVQMAFLYLRKEDFKEAAKFYGKAAGPWGLSFIENLSARQKQLEMFANVKPYVISGKSVAVIDFVKLDPLPIVKASINGWPLNFILDTGGEDIFLDDDVAKQIGIQVSAVSKVAKGSAAGSGADIGYSKINEMELGGIAVENIPVSILDMNIISEKVFEGFQVDGIIGTRFLMHFLSTIDYQNEQLILRQLTKENRTNFQNSLEKSKPKTIPFILVATHLMLAEGSFNGQNQGKYFIDTGVAKAGILSSEKRMKNSGVNIDWKHSKTGAGVGGDAEGLEVVVKEVTLGIEDNLIVKNNVPGVVMKEEIAIFDGQLGVEINGLISHEFFKGFALTFDFENMLLILENENRSEGKVF